MSMQVGAALSHQAIVLTRAPSQPSPAGAAAQPTAAPAGATGSANQGQYDASVEGLAGLLSEQGKEIMPPDLMLALHAMQQSSGFTGQSTVTSTGPADPAPATASQIAGQMMDSLGSKGVLTLAEVEKAENGSTSPGAATSLEDNSYSDVAADFANLSGGSNVMTTSQLTSAIQKYMDTQSQHPYGFGTRILSQPV
jgi:hypothetical protein